MEWKENFFGHILQLSYGTAAICKSRFANHSAIYEWQWDVWTQEDKIARGYCDTIEEAKAYAEALLNAARVLKIRQTLPVIDWENAPDDAVCHANDKNGRGYFYNCVPAPRVMADAWSYIIRGYDYGINVPAFYNDDWKETLQMRPGKEG